MTLAQQYLRLSQTLSTKLCHDLSDGIGAIDNCASMIISDDKATKAKAAQLMEANIKKVIGRLHFYKHAYGLSSEPETSSLQEITQLCENGLNLQKGRIKFAHAEMESAVLSKPLAKAVMCLIASASSSFNTLEAITISMDKHNDRDLNMSIKTTGRNFIYNQSKVDVLSGHHLDTEMDFRNCHEYYIYYLVSSQKFILTVTSSKDALVFNITGK